VIAYVNGCFDILHIGHVTLLEFAKSYRPETKLIVGINSDQSVRRLKGEGRPVFPASARRHVLMSLRAVDEVAVFDEDSPVEQLAALYSIGVGPDVVFKGADYQGKDFPERRVIIDNNGIIAYVKLVEGASTTGILETIDGINPSRR